MKILLLTSSMAQGGTERVAASLANAWVARGDCVMLMPTFSGGGKTSFYALSPDVRLTYLADLAGTRTLLPLSQWRRVTALRRFIAEQNPDVIVAFLANVNVTAIVAGWGLNVPVLVCERTDPFVMPMPAALRWACRATYRFADALVVQTQAVAAKYSRRAGHRICVIPNPIPREIREARRSSLSTTKRLLAVGRLSGEKQFDVLVRIFAGLAPCHPDWTLRIVGDGPLRAELEQQVDILGLTDKVELPGSSTDMATEFERAHGFVLTSRYEGFPNAMLEAMAAGLPCVALDCPSGPREMSQDGQIAMLVPPDDLDGLRAALDRMLSDDLLRCDLGVRARASAYDRFRLERVLQHWDTLFRCVGAA